MRRSPRAARDALGYVLWVALAVAVLGARAVRRDAAALARRVAGDAPALAAAAVRRMAGVVRALPHRGASGARFAASALRDGVAGSAEAAVAAADVLATAARTVGRVAARGVGLLWCGLVFAASRTPAMRVRALLAGGVVEQAARRATRWFGARRRRRPSRRRAPIVVAGLVALALSVAVLPGPALTWASRFVKDDVAAPGAGLKPLAQRSTIVGADGSTIAVLRDTFDRRVVPLERVPKHVIAAVLAAEDTRFWEHEGYDLAGMARAALADVRAGSVVQGGSTITQQLAKQNFVGDDRTIWRKAKEVLYAIALEDRLGKTGVLERYVNEIYFGNGAYGIAAAAEAYFGVPPEALTLAQAAALAGMIRSPATLDPRRSPARARARRDDVLRSACSAGLASAEAVEAALDDPLVLAPPPPPPPTNPLVETVKRAFLADDTFGPTRRARVDALFRGGLRIETTIDPRLQAAAERIVRTRFPDANGPTAAIAAVDPRNGAIRALYGGDEQRFDLAAQGRRQPGSAFKTLAAIAAVEHGVPPDARFTGTGPIELDYGGPERWTVDNYEQSDVPPVNLHQALVHSVNTAVAEISVQVGTDALVDVVRRLGIDVERALGPPAVRGPAIGLGGVARGVTPLEMATAYATLAAGGVRHEPFLIRRVVDAEGRELYRHDVRGDAAVSAPVAAHVRSMLQDVVRHGTGTAAQVPGWDPFGKTGTTQDHADAWFVGAVPSLSTAVWSGHAAGRVAVRGMTGGAVPAAVWRAFMAEALAGFPPEAFPAPAPPAPAAPAPPSSPAEPSASSNTVVVSRPQDAENRDCVGRSRRCRDGD